MKYLFGLIASGFFGIVFLFVSPVPVSAAAVCYGSRTIYQYQCAAGGSSACLQYSYFCPYTGGSYDSLDACNAASGAAPGTCVIGWGGSGPYPTYGACPGTGANASCSGVCQQSCAQFASGSTCQYVSSSNVGCDLGTCQSSSVTSMGCQDGGYQGAPCTLTYGTLGCWIDVPDTPTPAPTLPPGVTPTVGPVPTSPPPATCGNGSCDINENSCNCSGDCPGSCIVPPGSTPTPTPVPSAIIRARAHLITRADTSCSAVAASTSYLDGTTIQFSPSSASTPPAQTQGAGGQYVTFTSLPAGTYTVSPTAPSGDYVITQGCWTTTGSAPYGQGLSNYLADRTVMTWELGYTLGTPWFQTGGGGDVYAASGYLQSYVPSGASPRYFALNNTNGYAGVVSYGSSYDFDSSPTAAGDTYISSTNRLVNETQDFQNFYLIFWRKFGGPLVPDYDPIPTPLSQPASRVTPYYLKGDVTTSGDWTVGDGQTLILLVDGNVTINGKITITGNGFFSVIASGNITVSSSVGVPPTSASPVLEGYYITSGTFQSGTSGAGTERLVVKGSVIANSVLLQRDLGDTNTTTAAELFLYNPALLFSMPRDMMDVPYYWQEVAP